jgi:arylsulfatase A-like enzyme
MTGRHGFRTGIGAALGLVDPGLDAEETLLPEILGPAGIRTGLVGKWHLGNDLGAATPTAEGFDSFVGNLAGALPSYYNWPKTEDGATSISTTYATTDCIDEALQFIADSAGSRWFLVLSLNAPHFPYQAPPAALHTQNLDGLDPLTTPLPFYKAMIQAADHELGRLLASLPAATVSATNIVVVGDNGTPMGVVEPPLTATTAKGSLYQGGVRVPLIVAGPAVGGRPRTEGRMVHVVDLFATLAGMQGVNASAAVPAGTVLDSVSFLPLLSSPLQPAPRAYVYTQQFLGSEAMARPGDGELMRNARYTLLRTVQPSMQVREEFYDLETDPLQTTDLLQQPLSVAALFSYTNITRELAVLRDYPLTTIYGLPCTGSEITPTLTALPPSEPAIGKTLLLGIGGPGAEAVATVGAVGFRIDSWMGNNLPLDLTSVGMTGCRLWIAPEWTTVRSGTVAASILPISIPDSATLLGERFYVQAFTVVEGANPLNLLATNAVVALVGK